SAAAALMEVNPFDQPDVEQAKRLARESLKIAAGEDTLPVKGAAYGLVVSGRGMYPHFNSAPEPVLKDFFTAVKKGDYAAILAYLDHTDKEIAETVSGLRTHLRDALGVATCLCWGPRYLHSTGQLHKGGPASGVFIMLASNTSVGDLKIPGMDYSFRELEFAQAFGDFRALETKKRRVVFFNLNEPSPSALKEVASVIRLSSIKT
ncbi:MAG: hypothetical protein HY880_06235, partial [Deltaproteobacteria bacterium]|nr:hypothetical protein [Deltaproteobacteria bacterium]